MRIFHLESYAFGGIGTHGHLYGKLTARDEEESAELRCVLSPSEAALFNKQDRTPHSIRYRPGDESTRFHTRERLTAEAIRRAGIIANGEEFVLLDGRAAYMDPQPCLFAPPRLKARIDEMVKRWKGCDGWEGTSVQRRAAKAIAAEWDDLVAEIEAVGSAASAAEAR